MRGLFVCGADTTTFDTEVTWEVLFTSRADDNIPRAPMLFTEG